RQPPRIVTPPLTGFGSRKPSICSSVQSTDSRPGAVTTKISKSPSVVMPSTYRADRRLSISFSRHHRFSPLAGYGSHKRRHRGDLMGFRFQKSIRLAKGLKINLSKTGASLSIGGRGATVNLSKRGAKVTAGLPGTGISWSETVKPTGRPDI